MSLNEKIIEAQELGRFNFEFYEIYRDCMFITTIKRKQIKYQQQSADQYRLARLMMGITE